MRKHQGGFTLIELMIVVTIIAVLASIAYPAYQRHLVKTRRVAASGCLLEAAQFMERFYTTNLRYDATRAGTAVALPALGCNTDLAGFYTVQLRSSAANAYVVEAIPQGMQATKDAACGTLAVNQTGAKFERSTEASASTSECW